MNICRYCDQECTEGSHICRYHDERAEDFRRARCVECGRTINIDAILIRDVTPFNCVCGNRKFILVR